MTLTATTKVQTDRRQMHRFALGLLYLCLMAVAAIVLSSPASGQTAKKKEAAEKDEKPKLRAVTLKTKDGVVLRAFYQASNKGCLLYTSPSPRDRTRSRMPSSA